MKNKYIIIFLIFVVTVILVAIFRSILGNSIVDALIIVIAGGVITKVWRHNPEKK